MLGNRKNITYPLDVFATHPLCGSQSAIVHLLAATQRLWFYLLNGRDMEKNMFFRWIGVPLPA